MSFPAVYAVGLCYTAKREFSKTKEFHRGLTGRVFTASHYKSRCASLIQVTVVLKVNAADPRVNGISNMWLGKSKVDSSDVNQTAPDFEPWCTLSTTACSHFK